MHENHLNLLNSNGAATNKKKAWQAGPAVTHSAE